MSARALQLVIDARPRGSRGLLAAEVVLGRSLLDHTIEAAVAASASPSASTPSEPLMVHARQEEHGRLRELAGRMAETGVVFVSGAPRADAAVLRTDRFYDAARLRRGLRRGRSPEEAVLWRLDGPETIQAAEAELTRRLTYQPLGKYWAFPVAQRLAELLRPTKIRPNALTLAAAGLMLSATAWIGFGPSRLVDRLAVALALTVALVLDTGDGRLARLQGTCSAFGRWLDNVLDELADLALHAAIAWAAFARDGRPMWLLLGMAYASGKYLFLVQSIQGDELEAGGRPARESPARSTGGGEKLDLADRCIARLSGAVRLIGHADLRWHLWIVLALLGRLDFALVVYAGYFPARALAGVARKGVRHA